ncbi:glycoside hydrolase family 43 protein [Lentisphaera marina]|uniref:Glycoside hydrolase family 43 protein n=1 Tax=Lentisphaera profundi TaxID=1658616 RepID=A0ABY7VPU3_9BACT|nr:MULTISPECIES: glycoside hydrolase family 43 protein [Lentisphaera]MDD7984649.1 glycoside hydrolase family 43 protein [Lentisphaera marina]WDE95228.1 glycoside hydrolase family 43 protein [Lentisphaera profundi]
MITKYKNPILPGFYPDPSVCRVGDTFYMVTSTFEYFPGVPIFKSKNLIDWEQVGHCLTRQSQLDLINCKASGGIYAPTIRYHEGLFYMVTTDTTGIGNFYVTAEDPAGDWSDPIKVPQGGIDPSLFWDDDGKCYFASNYLHWNNRQGVYLREMNPKTGELLGDEPTFMWGGTGGKYPEAPHTYKKNNWYYLIIAEGGTEFTHAVTMARAKEITGPYEPCPHNPILSHRGSSLPIQSTGHAELFEDQNGQWWMVCLGVRHSQYPFIHHLGRETYLAPVNWDGEWPQIQGDFLQLCMDVPQLLPAPVAKQNKFEYTDNFADHELDLGWNFRRNPIPGSWSLESQGLRLKCLKPALDSNHQLSWIGRRQQHFDSQTEINMSFDPKNLEEAGLSVGMNENHWHAIAIHAIDGKRFITLKRALGSIRLEVNSVQIPAGGEVKLKIISNDIWYIFSAEIQGKTYELGQAEVRHIATEVAGGFTGVYTALYASSNGAKSANSALFHSFSYKDISTRAHDDRSIVSMVNPDLVATNIAL